jgi:hypothetical protein
MFEAFGQVYHTPIFQELPKDVSGETFLVIKEELKKWNKNAVSATKEKGYYSLPQLKQLGKLLNIQHSASMSKPVLAHTILLIWNKQFSDVN